MTWLLLNWKLVLVGMLIATLAAYGTAMRLQRDGIRAEYAEYRTKVATAAQAAAEAALKRTIEDEKRKEKVDVENLRLRADLDATTRRLRDARRDSSFVPPAAANAPSPANATFDRAKLERAIQQLDDGVQELIAEGDRAIVDLDTAKKWGLENGR